MQPDQLMLRIADGVHNASDRTEAYAAVATLLGGAWAPISSPMLEKGSEAILDQAKNWKTLTDGEVESLHRIKVEEERFWQGTISRAGQALSGWVVFFDVVSARARQFWALLNNDIDGARAAAKELENLRAGLPPGGASIKFEPIDTDTLPGTGGGSSSAGAGGSGSPESPPGKADQDHPR